MKETLVTEENVRNVLGKAFVKHKIKQEWFMLMDINGAVWEMRHPAWLVKQEIVWLVNEGISAFCIFCEFLSNSDKVKINNDTYIWRENIQRAYPADTLRILQTPQ